VRLEEFFICSLISLQVSPCECSAKNPDSDYPNQYTKACPRFQAMHCWCPPATGPNQPHEKDCSRYKRPAKKYMPLKSGPFFGHGLQYQAKLSAVQAQAYNHALQWLAKQNPAPLALATAPMTHSIECTCAAQYGVIGHAAFCPLGEKADNPDEGVYIDLKTAEWL
jgi:hypothetical protein